MSKPTPEALNLVKNLMELPENNMCADCQHKVAKWASSTLGVFICIDCSGIHRNLGTHITFVRSCTLDSWTPDQARVMKRVGNKVANEYWEARLPPDFIRPSSTDRVNMEAFIRAKYVQKLWAAQGEPPHLRTNYRPSGGVSTGQKPSISMYNGYFQHNPTAGNQYVFGANQPRKMMSVSRSIDNLEFGRKPQAKQSSMELSDFMNIMNSGNQSNTQSNEADVNKNEAPQSPELAHVSSSPLAIQNPSPIAEVKEPENPAAPQPEPKPELKPAKSAEMPPQERNIPLPKPAQSQQTYPLTGSTAHDIMMAAQNAPKNKLPKFAKKKGVARFVKRPSNDAVFDQMLQMSENANRPESAPVHMLPTAETEITA